MKQRTVSVFCALIGQFMYQIFASLLRWTATFRIFNSTVEFPVQYFSGTKRVVSNLFNFFMLGFDARNVAVRRGQAQT